MKKKFPLSYQDRVVKELNDLLEKHDKLVVFMADDRFLALQIDDRFLMDNQRRIMGLYIETLRARIARFK